MNSIIQRYGRQELQHGTALYWVTTTVASVLRSLDEWHEPDPDSPDGWLKLIAPVSRNLPPRAFLPVECALRAAGWNHVELDFAGPQPLVHLFALYVPLTVFPLDGEPFSAGISPVEDVETVVKAISKTGTWRYRADGMREFLPSHRIARMLHGEETNPL